MKVGVPVVASDMPTASACTVPTLRIEKYEPLAVVVDRTTLETVKVPVLKSVGAVPATAPHFTELIEVVPPLFLTLDKPALAVLA